MKASWRGEWGRGAQPSLVKLEAPREGRMKVGTQEAACNATHARSSGFVGQDLNSYLISPCYNQSIPQPQCVRHVMSGFLISQIVILTDLLLSTEPVSPTNLLLPKNRRAVLTKYLQVRTLSNAHNKV
jgi:hypothetical protein